MRRNLVKKTGSILVIAIAFFILLTINRPSSAQSNLNLRSDIISLNSRISRLEQEVNRLRSSTGRGLNPAAPQPKQPARSIPNPTVNPPVVDGVVVGRSDPLYERFATLLIELKEDVRSIDRRLSELETVDSQ